MDPETNNPNQTDGPESIPATTGWDVADFGFIGNPTQKLDDRGRLKLTSEFKAVVKKKYGESFTSFYITSRDGKSAEVYPMPVWGAQMKKITGMPASLPQRIKLLNAYNLYGDTAEMDSQGRMQLPEELRKLGFSDVEVKVSGEGSFFRVTPLAWLQSENKQNPLTLDDADVLSKFDL